jgi:hypothetical protein
MLAKINGEALDELRDRMSDTVELYTTTPSPHPLH